MALVFIHGIGNRSSSRSYAEDVALRDAFFKRFLIARAVPELIDTRIGNPLWGDLGAQLYWNHASFPRDGQERFGSAATSADDIWELTGSPDTSRPVIGLAQQNLADAVDLLYTLADLRGRSDAEIESLADLAVALVDYCDAQNEAPTWLTDIDSDEDLLDKLSKASSAPTSTVTTETLGTRTKQSRQYAQRILRAGIGHYRRRTLGPSARLAAIALRRLVAKPASLLIGDVFCYLSDRGTVDQPGPIVALLIDELDAARANGPLIVVAHSMGGNIAYDILSSFRTDIKVDVLITVGSQVGLFEELKLFHASDRTVPRNDATHVTTPANIRHWINVIDPADMLAYCASPIFTRAVDYTYPSEEPWAHSAYFRQPHFHRRLATRVSEVLQCQRLWLIRRSGRGCTPS